MEDEHNEIIFTSAQVEWDYVLGELEKAWRWSDIRCEPRFGRAEEDEEQRADAEEKDRCE